MLIKRLPQYFYLMRFHKPIGILLLLWPTLWALTLAGSGHLNSKIVGIFITGVILMRAAGCIMSDTFDRHFDAQVRRTRERPLASGTLNIFEAMILMMLLSSAAFMLVFFNCNQLTIELSFFGAAIAFIYPLLKRVTHLPQVGLGVAYTWGVPMAFAAVKGSVGSNAWFLFLTGAIWPVIFDTFYALVDREDDCKIGVKSTAILFGRHALLMIALLQLLWMMMLIVVGFIFHLNSFYFESLFGVFLLFIYQLYLAKDSDRDQCFKAFLNNNWVGFLIFIGIYASYL